MFSAQLRHEIRSMYSEFLRELKTVLNINTELTEKPREIYVLINQKRQKHKLLSIQNGNAIVEDSDGWIVAYDLTKYAIRFTGKVDDHG